MQSLGDEADDIVEPEGRQHDFLNLADRLQRNARIGGCTTATSLSLLALTPAAQKSAVSGSGPIRPSLRSRAAIFARSSASNEKSNTSKFSRMRDGVTDFGITM